MPFIFHVRTSEQEGINFELSFRYRLATSGRNPQVGDWAVFHARSGANRRYHFVGIGQVGDITADSDEHKVRAVIASYISFPNMLPPRRKDGLLYVEPYHGLRRLRDHHAEQQNLREITLADLLGIVEDGFREETATQARAGYPEPRIAGMAEPDLSDPRRLLEILVRRDFRDRANRRTCLAAYWDGCAITGDVLSPGDGRTLCEASHIVPVAERGPDSIRNLILLSPSAHKAWDAGLVAIGADGTLLRSPRLRPRELAFRADCNGKAWLPRSESDRPAPEFLARHRRRLLAD